MAHTTASTLDYIGNHMDENEQLQMQFFSTLHFHPFDYLLTLVLLKHTQFKKYRIEFHFCVSAFL